MLRRTTASKVPFEGGSAIGFIYAILLSFISNYASYISKLKAYHIHCTYTDKERAEYQAAGERLLEKFSKEDGRKGQAQLSVYREFALTTMSLALPGLDEKFDPRTTNAQQMLSDPHFYHDWIRATNPDLHPELQHEVQSHLEAFCVGAPKLRILLRNLRQQVSRRDCCKLPKLTANADVFRS